MFYSLSDSPTHYLADNVFVHHWPKNSLEWSDSLQKKLDISINKNSNKKNIIVNSNTIGIEDFEFTCLKKIGVSVLFLKKNVE